MSAQMAGIRPPGGRPIVLLFDNRTYGTIRMQQEREQPRRVCGTDIVNPDFGRARAGLWAAYAQVFETAEFRPAVKAAFAHDGPTAIHLGTDPERISTRTTVAKLARRGLRHRDTQVGRTWAGGPGPSVSAA